MKAEKNEIAPDALRCLLQIMQVDEAVQQCKNSMYCLNALAEITKLHLNHS